MPPDRRERQQVFDLTQEVQDLQDRLNGAKTQNGELVRQRDEAVRGWYDDREEVASLRHQLAAKTAECRGLEDLLNEERGRMLGVGQSHDSLEAEAAATAGQLLEVRTELIRVRADRAAWANLSNEVRTDNAGLQAEVQRLSIVGQERDELARQNKRLVSEVKLLQSKVGNFLVGEGRIPLTTYLLNTLGALPLVGSIFRRGSENSCGDYNGKRTGR